MIPVRAKVSFALMGADVILALFMASVHDPRCFIFVALAAFMNYLGNETYRLANLKENDK